MTRTQRITRGRSRRTAAIGLVSAAAALSMMVPSSASATARVASPAVGETAAQALEALARWQATASVIDYADFIALRAETATLASSGLGVGATALRDAWAAVSVDKQEALLAAVSQLGVPYRSMKSEEGQGFDCSGLMLFAFRQAGVELPRSSGDQISEAEEIDPADGEAGDLVYYPGHISMYLGAGLMVHSPFSGSEVEVRHVFDRSLRWGDVFDDSVAWIEAPADPVVPIAPTPVRALRAPR